MLTVTFLIMVRPSAVILAVMFTAPLVLFTLKVLFVRPEVSVLSDAGLIEPYFASSTVFEQVGVFVTRRDTQPLAAGLTLLTGWEYFTKSLPYLREDK